MLLPLSLIRAARTSRLLCFTHITTSHTYIYPSYNSHSFYSYYYYIYTTDRHWDGTLVGIVPHDEGRNWQQAPPTGRSRRTNQKVRPDIRHDEDIYKAQNRGNAQFVPLSRHVPQTRRAERLSFKTHMRRISVAHSDRPKRAYLHHPEILRWRMRS